LDLRCVPRLRSQIEREQYDLVHFHTKRAHTLSLWLPRGAGRPKYVVTRRMDYPEKRNWYTRRLYNQRVDGVVAISKTIVSLLTDAGVDGRKIRLIHSGIDAGRFSDAANRSSTHAGETVVGCLGVLEARKGHRYLLEAASLLKSRGLKARYVIGGEGSLRAELEKQTASNGLSENTQFVGFVSDAPGFLADIDIFVMPSLYEGLGVAALEAMAAGKAVIASRVGGLAESVVDGETGLLVSAQDGAALADAIAQLIGEPERAREMGRSGRARVLKDFTMEQMAKKNEAFYYELLGAA
jgi:glycosyltransferase involved in cell wall biosynthesis